MTYDEGGMTMKVVINAQIGGFGVRKAVFDALGLSWMQPWEEEMIADLAKEGFTREDYDANETTKRPYVDDDTASEFLCDNGEIARNDPRLIAAIEAIGADAAGQRPGALKIVEIPDGIAWHVDEGEDGREWVAEDHRTWS